MGAFIEEGIKSGKIQSMAVLQATSKAIQTSSINGNNKKWEDVSAATPYYQPGNSSYRYPNNHQIIAHVPVYNTQPYHNPPRAPAYQNPPRPYAPVQAITY
ncbi:hypothetical protein P3S67_012773 [Capsicum chacoense]